MCVIIGTRGVTYNAQRDKKTRHRPQREEKPPKKDRYRLMTKRHKMAINRSRIIKEI